MPILRLTSHGHYPDRVVLVTPEELEKVKFLEKERYLCDSEEGRELAKELGKRPQIKTVDYTATEYI